MLMRVASIGGPLLGGLLYALGGGELTYAVCCACFGLGVGLLLRVAVAHATAPGPAQGTMFERFGAGIAFIRSRPIILGTISLDLFAVLLGGVVALLPIYAQEVLHVGPAGLGALRSAMAVGEVSAGLYLSTRPFNHRVGRTMFIAVAAFGAANLVFALSTVFWLSFAALMVAGAADMVSVYIRGALVQFSTPDAMPGPGLMTLAGIWKISTPLPGTKPSGLRSRTAIAWGLLPSGPTIIFCTTCLLIRSIRAWVSDICYLSTYRKRLPARVH